MHEVLMERAKELGIDVILEDRVRLPPKGFPTDGSHFDITLSSGRTISANLAVRMPVSENLPL